MSLIERDRVAAALRDEFSAWIAGHPNAGVFDWNVAAENVLRAANPPGAVRTLEGLEQLFEDRERARLMDREDEAWRLVALALPPKRGQ